MDEKLDENDNQSSQDGNDSEQNQPVLDSEEAAQTDGDSRVAQAQAEALLMGAREQRKAETKNTQKKILIILAVAVALSIAMFFIVGGLSVEDEPEPVESATIVDQETEVESVLPPTAFSSIVYAHAPTTNGPRELFRRPVGGGDREPLDFSFGSKFLNVEREGNSYVAYSYEGGPVYFGVDAELPQEIYTTEDSIASVDLDPESQSVAISTLTNPAGTAISFDVIIVDLASREARSFFSTAPAAEPAGQFIIHHWDNATDSFIGQRVRPNSEDATTKLERFSADGTAVEIFDNGPSFAQSQYVFSEDGTRALFYVAKDDFSAGEIATYNLQGGIAEPAGAPFTLYELDVSSGQSTAIETIGEIGDNDELERWPVIAWADFADGQRASYAYMDKLYVQDGSGGYSNYFATDQNPITSIYAIDDNEVVVGASINDGERISYYNIESRNGAIVMETLSTTTILAITRQ